MIHSIEDLVVFLKRFHKRWPEPHGLDATLIPADLPPGLAMLYREFGALIEQMPTPFNQQNYLVPLREIKRVDGMVEFACENQWVWTCRCALGEVDPPVYLFQELDEVDIATITDAEILKSFAPKIICPSLNHFLITFCLNEAVYSSGGLRATVSKKDAIEKALTYKLTPIWLNASLVDTTPGYIYEGLPSYNFYQVRLTKALILLHEKNP